MSMTSCPAAEVDGSPQKAVAASLEVLDRFVQRHRNQHRVARWWSHLGVLRRSLRRLMEALAAQDGHAAAMRKRHGAGYKPPPRAAATADRHRDNVVARAAWLHHHILPEAYLSFTQLAADKQHAALGLFLVGVVAFLQQSLGPLIPEHRSLERPGPADTSSGLRADGEVDVGVAVSRTLFDANPPPPQPKSDTAQRTPEEAETVQKRPVAATVRAPSTTPPSLASPTPTVKLPKRKQSSGAKSRAKEGKPKRPKKQGDEFASLFESLL